MTRTCAARVVLCNDLRRDGIPALVIHLDALIKAAVQKSSTTSRERGSTHVRGMQQAPRSPGGPCTAGDSSSGMGSARLATAAATWPDEGLAVG